MLLVGGVAVDARFEQVLDARGDEDVLAVGAGGDHGAAKTRITRSLGEAHRPLVGLDTVLLDQLEHQLVLAVADAADRLGVTRVARRALGQLDPARLQKRAHAVVAGLAVHILVVVLVGVELLELLAGLLGASLEVLVEGLLPRAVVDLGGLGEHAVEVEQACGDGVGQPQHARNLSERAAASACASGEAGALRARRARRRPAGRRRESSDPPSAAGSVRGRASA